MKNINKICLENKLSKREQEVFRYLIIGYKTNNIAETLRLKSNTISTIKKNIFVKFKVSSIIELYNSYLKF